MICTAILLINLTTQPWTKQDFTAVTTAQETCKTRYNSCLFKITKKEPQLFHVVCRESK